MIERFKECWQASYFAAASRGLRQKAGEQQVADRGELARQVSNSLKYSSSCDASSGTHSSRLVVITLSNSASLNFRPRQSRSS